MAQTYEIDINRYNGTDYDTLLPTPATHAATHKADGTDPIVCQTGNYGDKTVTGAKMADGAVGTIQLASNAVETAKIKGGSVTRAKLAQDALFSPIVYLGASSAAFSLSSGSVGKTFIANDSTTNFVITIPADESIPTGFEVALFRFNCKSMKITFASNIKVLLYGNASALTAPSFTLEPYAMVALKKISGSDYWLLTGPAEVVS